MDKESRQRLRNPPRSVPDLSKDPALRLALRQFIANGHSDAAYEANRRACMEEHPERELPSLKCITKTVEELTGIKPIVTDMCKNSCIAYTGPRAKLKACPICPERAARYEVIKGKNVARRTFDTYPFGPQAQALMRDRECAERMHHRRKITEQLKAKLALGEKWDVAEDIYFPKDFMDAVDDEIINPDDMLLMFSVDGAQLYESKTNAVLDPLHHHKPSACPIGAVQALESQVSPRRWVRRRTFVSHCARHLTNAPCIQTISERPCARQSSPQRRCCPANHSDSTANAALTTS